MTVFHTYVDGDTITTADLNAVRTAINALETRTRIVGGSFVEPPDGSRTVFTVAADYVPLSTAVWQSGIRLKRGVGYTETGGDEITFVAAPGSGEELQIDYVED